MWHQANCEKRSISKFTEVSEKKELKEFIIKLNAQTRKTKKNTNNLYLCQWLIPKLVGPILLVMSA